ncbi:MAG: phage tail sheath protein FI [Crocinitomicaceae bacterium]|jgi:phage tail sheath protein FI
MSITLKTPGVYITEKSLLPPSIVQISTAIPVFFGYTAKAVSEPIRISSMKEFETSFDGAYPYKYDITVPATGAPALAASGAAFGTYFFYEAIQLYFANGGGPCYIISVGVHGDTVAPGAFTTKMEEVEKLDEATIIAFPEAASLIPGDYKAVTDAAFLVCLDLKDKFILVDSPKGADFTKGSPDTSLSDFRTSLSAMNPSYGAAYFPHLETTARYQISDTSTYGGATNTLTTLKNSGNADYQTAVNLLNESGKVTLPPSSLMAGVYANVDRSSGVWKAPANVALQGVVKPTIAISDSKQGNLNIDADSGKSINAIRTFAGRGTVVWGARTLDGNSNEWRYISVRRLFMVAEESIKKATTQFVFEPNDSKTWVKVNSMISSYLDGLWKEGGLAGATAKDAYFVNVGLGVTMTAQDILEGKMIVQVGMAAVRPAEFIVLEFSHFMNQ